MPKQRSKRPRINNGGYSTAAIAVEAQRGVHLIRKPAKLTAGNSQERALCTRGEPTRPGVGSLSRKRYTQCVEPNRTGHPRVPGAGAEKRRRTEHTGSK
jgi:hypothetical protein